MKSTMRNVAVFGILIAICIGSGGCFQAMGTAAHDKAVEKFPTYAETKAAWGSMPDGYGRVVLFVEKTGINPFGGFGYTDYIFEVNNA